MNIIRALNNFMSEIITSMKNNKCFKLKKKKIKQNIYIDDVGLESF